MSDRALNIFVLIDALGWQYVERSGFLSDLLPYRVPLRTVLGFSSGAIPSILTGLLPERHGRWNLVYYDADGSPFRWLRYFRFLPDRALDHRVTRKLVKETGRRLLGLGPTFQCCVSPRLLPWFNWCETRNIYTSGAFPGATSIFDRLHSAGIPHRIYSYHDGSDAELLRRAGRDTRTSDARFLFLYLCELDAFLHQHCQEPEAVESRLRWYAGELRTLFQTAREVCPNAGLSVFSDHGMTPVRNHIDLAPRLNALGLTQPGDYLSVSDATMARFWFFSDRARRDICALLNNIPCGRVLDDDERKRLGILFPDRRYGDVIFLMNPGWLISSSGFHAKGHVPSGMHGYHPDDPHSDAMFLSDRPPQSLMSGIRDIYGCMEAAVR